MENSNSNAKQAQPRASGINWHKLSKRGIIFSLFMSMLFLFLSGLEISLFILILFYIIKATTFKKISTYSPRTLINDNPLIRKLLENLHYDVERFEAGSTYYFGAVRFYKYSTTLLAIISTIVLGLDFTNTNLPFAKDYPLISKNIALVIGAVITLISTMAIYWNLEKYWLQNKIILQKFKKLRDDIELADTSGTLNPEDILVMSDEYKKIKFDFYKYWEGVQAERNSSAK